MQPCVDYDALRSKAAQIRRETLRIHARSPGTRIASSLSDVEIFVCLYYSGILAHDATNPRWKRRDRLIVSKGHGGVSLYPILADRGFIHPDALQTVGEAGSHLLSIPDCAVCGIESINGSLGMGLGMGAGRALALSRFSGSSPPFVFVVCGDGELWEGAVWEAVMFAGHRHLSNLVCIVDANRISMLNYCRDILDLEPFEEKFQAFGWETLRCDGHDIAALHTAMAQVRFSPRKRPSAIIADTIKGKGVERLEHDPLCHIRTLTADEVRSLTETLP